MNKLQLVTSQFLGETILLFFFFVFFFFLVNFTYLAV